MLREREPSLNENTNGRTIIDYLVKVIKTIQQNSVNRNLCPSQTVIAMRSRDQRFGRAAAAALMAVIFVTSVIGEYKLHLFFF